ncbi:MAG TPA: ankyrin repeat domain-containing protein [Bryobacteraceae bacterium]|jgi:ankyrin repeat protein|nr:ankyrin repeat domain-containing protein [Bryobacteraceae bacterium]
MSRQLPENPNIEFLKKEAKELRRSLPQTKLVDAQHALAKEYGFSTWAKLKAHVEALSLTPALALTAAVRASDAARVRDLLARHPGLRARVDAPLEDYGDGQHAMFAAVQRTDRATIDVLLANGADMRKRTEWAPGGFGVLDDCDPGLADFLIDRGAVLDIHSASRLARMPELREFVAADANAVHARGADGRIPLHFASTLEVAECLLANGAEIDARDGYRESTPAQHMLRVEHWRHYPHDRQPIARFLLSRGCRADILMAAALGDLELVRRLLDADPACVATRVSEEWFPKNTVYIPLLGPGRTAHAVARDFGHEEIYRLLLERTPHALKLAMACELGDEEAFRELLAARPDLAATLSREELLKLPAAAQSGNTKAVVLMLTAGWPVDTAGGMGATALHWAAFNGNVDMAREILRFHPPLELKSKEYEGTPLAWAIFGSGNGWNREKGDYPATVRALLEAGAAIPPEAEALEPSDEVLEVLQL